eukprot:gene7299-8115_t
MNASQQPRPTGMPSWPPPTSTGQPPQPGSQGMNQRFGPPKSSGGQQYMPHGQNIRQSVPMYSQNGTNTPPSSMNPHLNSVSQQGNIPGQNPVSQMSNQMSGMQINSSNYPSSQAPPFSQPGSFAPQKNVQQMQNAPLSSTSGSTSTSQRFGGPPGPGMRSGPPSGPMSGPPSGPMSGPPGGPMSGPPGGLMSGPPGASMSGPPGPPMTGPPGGPMSGPPGRQMTGPSSRQMTGPSGGLMTGPPSGPSSSQPGNLMSAPSSAPGMSMGGMPPSFSIQSSAAPSLSANSLSGPPVSGQPPIMTGGGRPGQFQGKPGYPGQAPPMPGQSYGSQQPGFSGPQMGSAGPSMSGPGPQGMQRGGPGQMPPMSGSGMPGAGPISSPMQQPAKKIDPDQMPSPVQVMNDDQNIWNTNVFQTSVRGKLPPLVSSKYKVQDDGNCNPRYMKSTLYNIPCNQDILKESNIPLAVMVTPFAKIPDAEKTLHVVDHGVSGPVRCNRCKAYMNPFMQFIDGGRRFVCNICSHSSEVPQEYFCHLDHQGRRVDIYERPELCFGSCEFVATTDYCKDEKFPSPPAFIFMIDVSYQSIQSGMVKRLTQELHAILDNLPKEAGMEESLIRVGFVTYSNNLHFYNVKDNLAQPQMMVVSDLNDVFVPLVDGFLVDVKKARSIVDSLLDMIPEIFNDTRETDVILGPAVQAGMEALKAANVVGKVIVFHSSLPIAEAPGKLKNREDRKLLATDKEKTILLPQSPYYHNLAKECVSNGVSVDLFLFPNSYIDIATIGLLATQTGGQIYRYSYFKDATHGRQFIEDLKKNLSREIGFDAIMRLRCSTGLRPVEFFGSFIMNNTTDVELASIDSDKAISIEVKHDDKIPEDGVAFVQCALLYTSVGGKRMLRIHNLAFNCCSQLAELYRCCELDTVMNFLLKHSLRQVLSSNPQAIKDSLVQRSAQMLSCYRQHCATPSTSGQLILPECMKLLPLYMNSLVKCDVLAGGSEMSSDDRAFLMQAALSMNTLATVPYIYPRLIPLHNIDLDHDTEMVPDIVRCSVERMEDSGVYLLENGISMFMWVGLQVSPDILQQLFHANTIGQVDIEMTQLPELDTPLSKRVRSIVNEIQLNGQRCLKLTIVRQRDKLEPWLKHYLVEDKGFHANQMSYVDFLCHIHKEIRNLLN